MSDSSTVTLFCAILAPAREGRTGAAPGAGAGVPGQQAHEEDQEDGERDHLQAVDFGAGGILFCFSRERKDASWAGSL